MCELDLELIVKIIAYTDSEITFKNHFLEHMPVISKSDFTITEKAKGMTLILEPMSAKYSHSSSQSNCNTKVKNTISYNSLSRLKYINELTEQINKLHHHSYNLLVETMSGHQFIIRSTPDTFAFDHSYEAGQYSSKISIDNISGAQLIFDEE